MENLTFYINKSQSEVNQMMDRLIDQKILEKYNFFYNGRNESEYSYSFIIKTANTSNKLKIFVLKITDYYVKISYFFNNRELVSQIKTMNTILSENLASSINIFDEEAEENIQKEYPAIQVNTTLTKVERKERCSILPKILKVIAIIVFLLGLITSVMLSFTKSITTDFIYFNDISYETSYHFNFITFLSSAITTTVYSVIIYSIGELLEVVIENNNLLKQKKDS